MKKAGLRHFFGRIRNVGASCPPLLGLGKGTPLSETPPPFGELERRSCARRLALINTRRPRRLLPALERRSGCSPAEPCLPSWHLQDSILRHDAASVVQTKRRTRPNAFRLDRAMIPLQLAVALRKIKTCLNMGHTAYLNKRLELLGDKLRAIIADDARRLAGELLPSALEDRPDILFGHLLSPANRARGGMHDKPAVAVSSFAVRHFQNTMSGKAAQIKCIENKNRNYSAMIARCFLREPRMDTNSHE